MPARNTIFLSFALALAEVVGARDIFIGVNALDYSGYPDCRPEFIEAFEAMANLATKPASRGSGRIRVHAPLIDLTKAEIIAPRRRARRRLLAHDELLRPRPPDGVACGACDTVPAPAARASPRPGVADPVALPSAVPA